MRRRRLGPALVALALGCVRPVPPPPAGRADTAPLAVAVLPFRAGGTLDASAVFRPRADEPADGEAGAVVARVLTDALAARGFAVASADAVAGAFARADTGVYDPATAARVGRRLGVDLVVLGVVSRFRQRDGTAWAAATPASVAYESALVRVSDVAVLRRETFDWTQQALSENLLQLPRFLEGGGRWLTREEILDGAARRSAERFASAVTPGR